VRCRTSLTSTRLPSRSRRASSTSEEQLEQHQKLTDELERLRGALTRLAKVLDALKNGPMTASEIAKATEIGTGTVSRMLTTMA
jgi:Fic family protein